MNYTQQLERRIEELQELLSMNTPMWVKHDSQEDRYFLFFNRCMLAQCYKTENTEKPWRGCLYSTMGSVDETEDIRGHDTLEAAKEEIVKLVYSKRKFGSLI